MSEQTDLQRRRELSKLTRPELIDWIIQAEQGHDATRRALLEQLRHRVEGLPR